MAKKWNSNIPQRFDWSMLADVQGQWCGLMFVLLGLAWQLPVMEAVLFMVMAGILVLIAIYDWRYGLIYDRLVILLFLLGGLPIVCGHIDAVRAGLGALLGSGLLGALRYLTYGGLGLGDVKLAVPLGLWLGWEDIMLCLLLASCLGVGYGGLLFCQGRIQRYTPIPFGPFLAIGALLSFAAGNFIRAHLEKWLW